ncbi:MAG: tRNA (adenosine(37)-N6)-dimethylallyltransferase MiaA [Bacteroidales bacterium]|nr:tRNA (adenosine(37)-N6)-dimethylallyltransferase MiaA [Bacteroidales bacterium]
MPSRSGSASSQLSHLLLVITGPTAAGKTAVALALARHFRTGIVSADSRQFYREMKIGTAVPSQTELSLVPHHFIGHLSITESYNVYRYEKEVLALLNDLFERRPVVVLAGGSGLYINAVLYGIDVMPDPDPELREKLKQRLLTEGIVPLQEMLAELDPEYFTEVDRNNPKRLMRAIEVCKTTGNKYSQLRSKTLHKRDFDVLQIGLELPREVLYQRIDDRIDRMMEEGLLEEVRSLYPYRHFNALNTVGYKELFEFFDGRITLEQAVKDIKTHSRKYAKRQLTWLRRDPSIIWLQPERIPEMIALAESKIRDLQGD